MEGGSLDACALAAFALMESAGVGLIDRAILEHGEEDEVQVPSRVAEWDPSLVELKRETRSPVPELVERSWMAARQRANCGLASAVHHAWVSVDSTLYLWDYRQSSPTVRTIPADAAIIAVAICPARASDLAPVLSAEGPVVPNLLLVVTTRLSVTLLGLSLGHLRESGASAGRPFQDLGPPTKSWSSTARPPPSGAQLLVLPLPGYRVAADGALFHCIRHSPEGRIFLLGSSPHLWELLYASQPGWFHSKCRLLRHSLRAPWSLLAGSPQPGQIRLLAGASGGLLLVVDDSGTLRLLRSLYPSAEADRSSKVSEATRSAPGRVWAVAAAVVKTAGFASSLEELAALPADRLAAQALALTGEHLASYTLVHLSPWQGLDGRLRLWASTAAGDRLRFDCWPAEADGGRGRSSFAGWLRLRFVSRATLSGSKQRNALAALQLAASAESGRKSSLLQEHWAPSLELAGTWLAAAATPGAPASELAVSVCTPSEGQGDLLELRTALNLDAPILDIAADAGSDGSALDAVGAFQTRTSQGVPTGRQTFVLLLSNRVVTVTLAPKEAETSPGSPAECCAFLMQLAAGKPPGTASWSTEDANVPSFPEQQRHLLLWRTTPRLSLGNWFSGLLQFLAAVLRPVWDEPIVTEAAEVSMWSLSKRRKGQGLRLAFSQALAQHAAARLEPVLRFVRAAIADQAAAAPEVPADAASRSRLYTTDDASSAVPVSQVLREVVDVADRAAQVLSLVAILHGSGCAAGVFAGLEVELQGDRGLLQPLKELVSTQAALQPAIQLCTVLIATSSDSEGSDGEAGRRRAQLLCQEIQERCPAIFAQLDLGRCVSRSQFRRSPTSDLLQRYAHYSPSGSSEDHWAVLTQGIRAAAAEDPSAALEICVQKVKGLPQKDYQAANRARSLVEAFLDALSPEPLERCSGIVEQLLLRTKEIVLLHSSQHFLQSVILDYLLSSPRLTVVLGPLLGSPALHLEALLQDRLGTSRAAGECLWRHYQETGQLEAAVFVLLQLADRPDRGCRLSQRIEYLHQAKEISAHLQASAAAPQRPAKGNLKQPKPVRTVPKSEQDVLGLRLAVAEQVQLPLEKELQLVRADQRVDPRWVQKAEQGQEKLQALQSLEELCQTAVEFGASQILLRALEMGLADGAAPDPSLVSTAWLAVFFQQEESTPYWPLATAPEARACLRGLFPLLMVRGHGKFFLDGDKAPQPESSHDSVEPGLLRRRVTALLRELREVLKPTSPLWDIRCIATVLEYSSCLWCKASGVRAAGREGTAAPLDRLWVAVEVLSEEPFSLTLSDLVTFYAEMLAQLESWAKDLKAVLPVAQSPSSQQATVVSHLPLGLSDPLSDQELHLHLAEVTVALVAQWMLEVDLSDPAASAAFQATWTGKVEALLVGLALRLNGSRSNHHVARTLLPEVLRLELKDMDMKVPI